MLAIQTRFLSFLRAPHFVAHRIVNHADDDFAFQPERDRNAEVRDSVKIIHGAVEWVDNPLMLARLVADDSFLAVERMLGKLFQQFFRDQLLRFNVDGELDVVRGESVDVLRAMEILPKQLTGGARGGLGSIEIMLHEEVEKLS